MKNPEILILLACYNGADYIQEQIESIQSQTHKNWRLIVRDDGSTDGTIDLVKNLSFQDDRIQLIEVDTSESTGAATNFANLMEYAHSCQSDYFMFSDQDDVWKNTKLQKLLVTIGNLENNSEPELPLLVHSDLEVVDYKLRTINKSFLRYQGIKHEQEQPLQVLLAQNFVTGCTTIFNRRLLQLALPVPDCVVMHDWWLALIASAAGHIGYVEYSTVRYRQHDRNQVGAQSLWKTLFTYPANYRERLRCGHLHFLAGIRQAQLVFERLNERSIPLDDAKKNISDFYSEVLNMNRINRIVFAFKLGIGPQHPIRRALYYFRLLRT